MVLEDGIGQISGVKFVDLPQDPTRNLFAFRISSTAVYELMKFSECCWGEEKTWKDVESRG